jgi:hypothetical protein
MNTTKSDMQQKLQRNRQVSRGMRWIGWITTPIIIVLIGLALYQSITVGQLTPLFWIVIGLIVLMIIGIIVGVIVAVRMGTGSFAPSSKVTGTLRTESQSVDTAGARSLHAGIEMAAGTLKLSGGATAAMDATFTYDDADWLTPSVQYQVDSAGVGNLNVKQQATQRPSMRVGPSEWTLRLNDQLPTELHVRLGAGTADLKLGGLPLTVLSVEGGAGAVGIDLAGEWKHGMEGYVRSGVGELTLRLPQGVGVRVETGVGIGNVEATGLMRDGDAYVNAAYGKSPITLNLAVEAGMGKLKLQSG